MLPGALVAHESVTIVPVVPFAVHALGQSVNVWSPALPL
jgi:hypothetical protein